MQIHILPYGELIIKGVDPKDLPAVEATCFHLLDKCQELQITYDATHDANEEDDDGDD